MLAVRGSADAGSVGASVCGERSPLADFREPSFVTELSNRVVAELEFGLWPLGSEGPVLSTSVLVRYVPQIRDLLLQGPVILTVDPHLQPWSDAVGSGVALVVLDELVVQPQVDEAVRAE
jgi:hypothetical protein